MRENKSRKIEPVHLHSSNKYLESIFDWAIKKQQQFIMTGKKGIINKDEEHPE